MSALQIARFVIAFAWVYQGLLPKIVQISSAELVLVSGFGLSEDATHTLLTIAGIGEIAWGFLFFALYRIRAIVYLNIVALAGLLLGVIFTAPQFLIEAFNPVTTNLPLIALSIVILEHTKRT